MVDVQSQVFNLLRALKLRSPVYSISRWHYKNQLSHFHHLTKTLFELQKRISNYHVRQTCQEDLTVHLLADYLFITYLEVCIENITKEGWGGGGSNAPSSPPDTGWLYLPVI